MVSYLFMGAFRNSDFRDEVLGARSAVGYWALTPITREDCEHRATTQFARKMNL